MEHILVVEDEKKISRIIQLQLEHQGYSTTCIFDGLDAINYINNEHKDIDLILLDIMLPHKNGIDILKHTKEQYPQLPIILLTAKDDMKDIIFGLNSGADDYMSKPFNFSELLARIQANIRKYSIKDESTNSVNTNELRFKNVLIDMNSFEVYRDNILINLSRTEFDLLYFLILNHDLVQSREQIISGVWGYEYDGNDNIVDVYIKHLRDKIDKSYDEKIIHTVRGRGYVVK
jgi:DNA-binding response OmpR family regulator